MCHFDFRCSDEVFLNMTTFLFPCIFSSDGLLLLLSLNHSRNSLICAWINGWVNNRNAGDLRPHRAHYDVTVMQYYRVHIVIRHFSCQGRVGSICFVCHGYPNSSYSRHVIILILYLLSLEQLHDCWSNPEEYGLNRSIPRRIIGIRDKHMDFGICLEIMFILLGISWTACLEESHNQGPVYISEKTSYRKISWSLEATRFVFRIVLSLWNLTGISAALLPKLQSDTTI